MAAGNLVRILSRNAYTPSHSLVSVVRGDMTSFADLKRAVYGCSEIFHCAAEKVDGSRMAEVNVKATALLYNLAVDTSAKFFCQLSSVGAIGRTDSHVVDESTSCNPMNRYEQTKLQAEEILSKGLQRGNIVILRPTNIFGRETLAEWSNNTVLADARRFLTGNERAHLVYVKDVAAAAVYLSRQSSDASVNVYIVSSDEEAGNTNREVQAWLASRIRGFPNAARVSAPILVPYWMRRMSGKAVNRGNIVYSSRKLRNAGFRLPFGLQAGLADATGMLTTFADDCLPESGSLGFPQG